MAARIPRERAEGVGVRPGMPSAVLALLLLWHPLVSARVDGAAAARPDICDAGLEQLPGPLGYRLHGDRCEGLYIQEVAGTDLVVLSFTEVFEEFDAGSGRHLRLEWESPGEQSVRLRAQGEGKLYYRMDTSRPGGTTSWLWSPDLLASLGLTRQKIGVVAWTRAQVGTETRDIYLPLRISQGPAPERSGKYRLVLLPERELQEVWVSLAEVGEDGKLARFLRDEEAIGYGYYPARRGFEIAVSGLDAPGTYYLEVGALVRGGGSTATVIWFVHLP